MGKNKPNPLKILLIAISGVAVLALVAVFSIFFYVLVLSDVILQNRSEKFLQEMTSIELPPNTEILEEMNKGGHVCGNDDCQVFAAIIVRSDLTLDQLDAYYDAYRTGNKYTDMYVTEDVKKELILLEQSDAAEEFGEMEDVYLIYSFN